MEVDDDSGVDNLDGMNVVTVDDQDDFNNSDIKMGSCHSSSTTSNFGVRKNHHQQQQQFRQRRHQGNDICHFPASQGMTTGRQPWRHSNVIDLILGFGLSFAAFGVTLTIELFSCLAYIPAVLFHILANDVFGRHPALVVCKDICLLISAGQMFTDSMILNLSVYVTELLGFIALILCTRQSGYEWQLFIRRMCHLIRWGIRSCLTMGWNLERIFLIAASVKSSTLLPLSPQTRPTPMLSSSSSSRTDKCLSEMEMDISSDTLSSDLMGENPNCNPDSECSHHRAYTENPNDVPVRTSTHPTAATFAEELLTTVTVARENVDIMDDDFEILPLPSVDDDFEILPLPVPPKSVFLLFMEYIGTTS